MLRAPSAKAAGASASSAAPAPSSARPLAASAVFWKEPLSAVPSFATLSQTVPSQSLLQTAPPAAAVSLPPPPSARSSSQRHTQQHIVAGHRPLGNSTARRCLRPLDTPQQHQVAQQLRAQRSVFSPPHHAFHNTRSNPGSSSAAALQTYQFLPRTVYALTPLLMLPNTRPSTHASTQHYYYCPTYYRT